MSDLDALRRRGIAFRALVDAVGIAVGGTRTMAELSARGMMPICQVNASGIEPNTSATLGQLRQRGIPLFCEVTELGVDPVSGATLAQLSTRGIPAFCVLDATGIAQGGTATINHLSQRGIAYFCPVDESGDETTLSGLVFSGSTTVPEDTAVSSSLGTFSVAGGSGSYSYAIAAGNGAGRFGITGDTLTLDGALDYETTASYALTIEADNGVEPVLTLDLTINVGDVAETAGQAIGLLLTLTQAA